MQAPNLAKLAPELSAEERYKLMTADFMARVNGEPQVMTESERKAMVRFPTTAMWKEYATNVVTFKFANTIWVNEIQIEKLRTFTCYLLAIHELEKIVVDAEDELPKERLAKQFESLKRYVKDFSDCLLEFRAYRDAIPILEKELCGAPLFSKQTCSFISNAYDLVDNCVKHYNDAIRHFCGDNDLKKYIRPVLEDTESFLVKVSAPDPSAVKELVDNLEELTEAELKSRE